MVSLINRISVIQKHLDPPLNSCTKETLSRIRERVCEARVRVYRIRPFLSFYMKNLTMLELQFHSLRAGF
jgi:hypothetical protein